MGIKLIIKGANFFQWGLRKEIDTSSFTWGPGGISKFGQNSGGINKCMCMTNPLPKAESKLTARIANNAYQFFGVYVSPNLTSPSEDGTYTEYGGTNGEPPDVITIEAGLYYEISVAKKDGSNANLDDAPSVLSICVNG